MSRNALLLLLLISVAGRAEEEPFYLTLDTPPAPELSPQEALESFATAPGFGIELVAAEPLVEDPVAVAWDEYANLYVAEMRGFMPDAWGRGDSEPSGMVVRLTDQDADGVYDQREVLLDGLVLPRAVAVVNEGLLIGEPPNLWLCPTDSGNALGIDCVKKIKLADYGNQPGGVEHAENGLLLAIDNWIYNAKSERRFKLTGREFTIDKTLFRGQWGIAQDNLGRLYYNTNSSLLHSDLYDAQPVIESGNPRAPGLNIPIVRDDSLYAVRVNPGVNRAYVAGVLRADGRLDKPTAASAMVVYRGDQFPVSSSHDVFVAEPAANVVVQLRLHRSGLSATTEHLLYPDEVWQQREFLASSDERFRPINVQVGPDGALYVVDMYRGIIQDRMYISEELRVQSLERGLDKPVGLGRIWRVVSKDSELPRGRVSGTSNDQLIAQLGHPNGWHRDTAQRLLVNREDQAIDGKLARMLIEDNSLAALHALWTLEGRASLDQETLLTALASKDRELRFAALRAGQARLSKETLLTLAASNDSEIAHHATMYLNAHVSDSGVMRFLVRSLAKFSEQEIRSTGVQVAASGRELELVTGILAGDWSQAQGQARLGMIEKLMAQALRGDADRSSELLDAVLEAAEEDVQGAMLRGLLSAVREDRFERVSLAEPHPLFSEAPETLGSEIAMIRQGFTWTGDDLPADVKPLSPEETTRMQAGRAYYEEQCAICHGADGRGLTSLGPALAGTDWVTGPSERLLRIILHGLQGPITVNGEQWNSVMPGHAAIEGFTDEVASGLLTYIGRSWGHRGRAIAPGFVREVRDIEQNRIAPWTAEELHDIDINTHYRAYAGTYVRGPFELKLTYNGQGLEIASIYLNGPLQELKEDHFLYEPRQLRLEFVWQEDEVTAVRLPDLDGAQLAKLSAQ